MIWTETKVTIETEEIKENGNQIDVDGLMRLNSKQIDDYMRFLDKDIKSKEIHVDMSGFSPEVASELGMEYLGNTFLITSIAQKGSRLVDERMTAYKQFLQKVYSNAWVKTMLRSSPVFGRINISVKINTTKGMKFCNIDPIFNALDRGKDFKKDLYLWDNGSQKDYILFADLRTKDNLEKKIKDVNAVIDNINPTQLTRYKTEMLLQTARDIADLKKLNINNFRDLANTDPQAARYLSIHDKISQTLKYRSSKNEAYLIYGAPPFIVYFGDKRNIETTIPVLHSDETEDIMDALLRYGRMRLSKERIHNWMKSIEDVVLMIQGRDLMINHEDDKDHPDYDRGERLYAREINKIERYKVLKVAKEAWDKSNRKNDWETLNTLLRYIDEGTIPDFSGIPYKIFRHISERVPLGNNTEGYFSEQKDPVLEELLSRIR